MGMARGAIRQENSARWQSVAISTIAHVYALQAGGRRFDPGHVHQNYSTAFYELARQFEHRQRSSILEHLEQLLKLLPQARRIRNRRAPILRGVVPIPREGASTVQTLSLAC